MCDLLSNERPHAVGTLKLLPVNPAQNIKTFFFICLRRRRMYCPLANLRFYCTRCVRSKPGHAK